MSASSSSYATGTTTPATSRRRFLLGAATGVGAASSLLSRPNQSSATPIITNFPTTGADGRGITIATKLGNGSKRVAIANKESTSVTVRNTDGSLVGDFTVGTQPFGLTTDPMTGHVWVTLAGESRVVELDPVDGAVNSFGTTAITPSARGIVAGNGSVWVTNFDQANVTELDAKSGKVLSQFAVGTPLVSNPFGICLDDWGNLWIALTGENRIIRVNPRNGNIQKSVPLTVGVVPRAVTYHGGFVWAATTTSIVASVPNPNGTVAKIRARDGVLQAEIPVGPNCRDLVVVGDLVYVCCADSPHQVWEVDAVAEQVTRQFPVCLFPHGIAFDGDSLWVSSGTGPPDPTFNTKVTIESCTLL